MKKSPVQRKRVMIQVPSYPVKGEPFFQASVQKRAWNEREKNAGKKMAKDFAEFLYHNCTGVFWDELKRAMKAI